MRMALSALCEQERGDALAARGSQRRMREIARLRALMTEISKGLGYGAHIIATYEGNAKPIYTCGIHNIEHGPSTATAALSAIAYEAIYADWRRQMVPHGSGRWIDAAEYATLAARLEEATEWLNIFYRNHRDRGGQVPY